MPRIILLLFALFLFYGLPAQVFFGLKTGPALSWLNSVDQPGLNSGGFEESRIGPQGGISFTHYLNDLSGLRAEVLYSNRGTKLESISEGETNLRYIGLPLLYDFQPLRRLHLEAGLEAAYLVNAETVSNSVIIFDTSFWNQRFDLALQLGCRYYFTEAFHLGIRYGHSLTPVADIDIAGPSGVNTGNIKYRNRWLSLSLGYEVEL